MAAQLMNEKPIQVLVVDDTVTYRRVVSDALASVPGIEVAGTAANGKIGLMKIGTLRPDVVTLDLEMPEMDGLEVLRQLRKLNSEVGVIVLSGTSEKGASTALLALELGAFDFVAKPDGGAPEENMESLRRELRSKIEAFARKRRFRKVIQGNESGSRHESSNLGDVGRRMSQIVGPGTRPASRSTQPASIDSLQPDIIVIGISTGGPQTLNRMLPKLPADLAAPILIVQHMPPVFTKSMADGLNKICSLQVSEANDGQTLMPGHVLIAPGGKQMKVAKATTRTSISITDDPPENSCRPSVDYLFRSVARAFGPKAVGVIMTGMGNDGAQGCRQMKQRGATIIAQSEDSCVVFGMPKEPVEEGIADVIASPDEIASQIIRLARPLVTA